MTETNALPRGWAGGTLEDVAEIRDDLRRPVNAAERSQRPGPYPYYGATGQVGWIDDFLMDGEFVLLGEDGAPFLDPSRPKAYIVTGKSWVNNHAHVLRGRDGVCRNRYLLYALNHADYRGYANGTTRLKLTQAAMRRLPIRLAPMSEQDRIVAKIEELFSDLDAGVAALERVRASLNRYRAAVLKAAVEGRLTEAWRRQNPPAEPGDNLLARTLTERRKMWEESQLRKFAEAGKSPPKGWREKYETLSGPDSASLPQIPPDWCWTTVEQIAEVQGGIQKQPKRAPRQNAYPYLRVANVLRDRLNLTVVHRIELFGGELDRLRLLNGDLLIVEGNGSKTEIGRSAIWTGEISDCVHQNHIIRVRPQAGSSKYLNIYWNSPQGNGRVMAEAASTSGLYTLSVAKVTRLPVPLPPVIEQEQIVAEVERRLSVVDVIEAEVEHGLKRAARLRRAILKRAFEGKLVAQERADVRAAVNGSEAPAAAETPLEPTRLVQVRREAKGINWTGAHTRLLDGKAKVGSKRRRGAADER